MLDFESKFQEGYGIQYPEGQIIRFNEHILKYELGMKPGKVLDYGCGSGMHLLYFARQGWTPYGGDISPTAIEKCRDLMPAYRENFHVIPTVPCLQDSFSGPFDLVVSNQALYYLGDTDIRNLVGQFHDLLRPGGVIFASMVGWESWRTRHIKDNLGDGLSLIELKGRVAQKVAMNFKNREDLADLFSPFEPLHLGFYSHGFRAQESPSFHHVFIGLKSQ